MWLLLNREDRDHRNISETYVRTVRINKSANPAIPNQLN